MGERSLMNENERVAARARFAEALQLQRKALGLNQKELARQIGIGQSAYNPYERGEKLPGVEALAVMDKFGIDVLSLLKAYRGDRP